MNDPFNPYPIPQHKSWWVIDSTKMQEFQDCPRQYMFKRLFGWAPIAENLHLVAGSAFHDGMEYLLVNGIRIESLKGAIDITLKTYYEKLTKIVNEERPIPSEFMIKLLESISLAGDESAVTPEGLYIASLKYYQTYYKSYKDKVNRPKSPGDLILVYIHYIITHAKDSETREVIHTEVYGTVPIDERRVMHFRIDAILKDELGLFVQEHKTLSQISNKWNNKWPTKIQIGTYLHALHMLFPHAEIKGLEINGMCLYMDEVLGGDKPHGKQVVVRVPISKSKELMAAWLWTVRHWYDLIEWNMEQFKDASPNDDILACFPMNGESCDKYFGCMFQPYCNLWSNPLKHALEPPPGFKIDWWSPADKEETAKTVVHLEKENK